MSRSWFIKGMVKELGKIKELGQCFLSSSSRTNPNSDTALYSCRNFTDYKTSHLLNKLAKTNPNPNPCIKTFSSLSYSATTARNAQNAWKELAKSSTLTTNPNPNPFIKNIKTFSSLSYTITMARNVQNSWKKLAKYPPLTIIPNPNPNPYIKTMKTFSSLSYSVTMARNAQHSWKKLAKSSPLTTQISSALTLATSRYHVVSYKLAIAAGTNALTTRTSAEGAVGTTALTTRTGAEGAAGTTALTTRTGAEGAACATALTTRTGAEGAAGTTALTTRTSAEGAAGTTALTTRTIAEGAAGTTALTTRTSAEGEAGMIGMTTRTSADGAAGMIGVTTRTSADGAAGMIGLTTRTSADGDYYYSLSSENSLYMRAQDGRVYLTSFVLSLIELIIILTRSIYLTFLFTPSIAMAPFADRSGHQFRKSWLTVVCRTLEKAGPAFIKWGQWAALRPNLFPTDLHTELSKLHTKAPVHSYAYTNKTIGKSFGRKISDIFNNFEEEPVVSRKFHRARLKNSTKHLTVAKISNLIPTLQWLRLDESVPQFSMFMMSQLDLEREAARLRGVWKDVSFPRSVYPLVHPSELVETYEHCESLSHYVDDLEGHDKC